MENTNTTETNESVDTGVENNTTAETGNESGDTLYANKYKSVDELKKGINNLGTKLPDYILDGLSNGALEMHYLELQKDFSSKGTQYEQTENTEANTEANTETETSTENTNNETENKENSGDIKKLETEDKKDYFKILSENYDKENLNELLDGSNFTEEFINTFKAGQNALSEKETVDIYSDIGGTDGYNKLVDWASSQLSQSDKEAFNKIIDSGDKQSIKFNINNLYERMKSSNKQPIMGDNTNNGVPKDIYNSRAEMITDMSNPLYKTDPAFQQKVMDKLKRTKGFN